LNYIISPELPGEGGGGGKKGGKEREKEGRPVTGVGHQFSSKTNLSPQHQLIIREEESGGGGGKKKGGGKEDDE